ncbi:MAG: hypothetical protein O3A93_00575 [Chloroflexi bacterium]|nr:hypothetical protein [Chloroflexota bacterium]MDA1269742.1 hypothetical protein [Chloroflexota bacterium]PKB59076.1 MAG: hypothetical protein BZY83_03620 [SAR202 cluster bacterium Casp-Chloro-G2]
MPELSKKDETRMVRYRGQSLRLLQDAMDEIRVGRWLRCEELLWGSLTLAVKGVALARGRDLDGAKAVEEYAIELGNENRDRRIREAFTKLGTFGETAERVNEARIRADHLVNTLEDVTGAVERLWDMAPGGDLLSRLVQGDFDAPEETDNDHGLSLLNGPTQEELDELEDMDGGPLGQV